MKKTKVDKVVIEDASFEETEQSEGQNLIDVDADQEVIADDGSHKCDTCSLEFATCGSTTVQFATDLAGDDPDRVILCGSFVSKLTFADVVAYSPSPMDRIGKKFTRDLPVPVPDDELAHYAQEMARLHALWVRTKLDAKAFAKSAKEVTDNCEKKELEIAEIINAGEEERAVTVYWSYDFTHHVKRLIRIDTNKVVEELPLDTDDYQSDLPLFDSAEDAGAVEVFETGTIEGDSEGETEETSQESLENDWPDTPMRQSPESPIRLIQP